MKKGTIFALIAATAAVAAGAAYVLSQKKKGCCGCDYDGGDLDVDCDGCCGGELEDECPVDDIPAEDADDAETGEAAAEAPAEDAPAEEKTEEA